MSGYLHRILHHLKTPGPSGIRPLVGSLYTASTTPSGSLASHDEVVVATPQTAPGTQTAGAYPYGAYDPVQTDRLVDNTRQAEEPDSHLSVQPLMPQNFPSEKSSRSIPVSEFSETPSSRSPETLSKPEPVSVQTARIAEKTDSPATPLAFHPLMPRRTAPIAFPSIPLVAPSPPVPDEIHINIGRIEVTAVPQAPAPRQSSRPPRRNLSLDEYLRKSDGRAQ